MKPTTIELFALNAEAMVAEQYSLDQWFYKGTNQECVHHIREKMPQKEICHSEQHVYMN